MNPRWLALAVFVALGLFGAWVPLVGHAAPPAQTDAGALFQQRCAACHGANAQGAALGPALDHLTDQTDDGLFQSISEGKRGTVMMGWKTMLSAEEIRSLVSYLRSLNAGTRDHSQLPPSPVVLPEPAIESQLAVGLDVTETSAGRVVARATVRNPSGQPVANVPVSFHLRTALGGLLEIGSARTDAQGSALIEYVASEGRNITLQAHAAPSGVQPVVTSATVVIPGGEQAWTPAPMISPSPPVPLIATLAVVLGGVWLTYAFVARHLLGILRSA